MRMFRGPRSKRTLRRVLTQLSFESGIAAQIDFDRIIRHLGKKNARKAHFN